MRNVQAAFEKSQGSYTLMEKSGQNQFCPPVILPDDPATRGQVPGRK